MKQFVSFIVFSYCILCLGQDRNALIVHVNPEEHTLDIKQELTLVNTSEDDWNNIILLDWANSFKNPQTPLGDRFAEDFKQRFQYALASDRGFTEIIELSSPLVSSYSRRKDHIDILDVNLAKTLSPGDSITINLKSKVTIPEDFASYGRQNDGGYHLRYWYLHPARYDNGWQAYSNKALDDFPGMYLEHTLSLHLPPDYRAFCSLKKDIEATADSRTSYLYSGKHHREIRLVIKPEEDAKTFIEFEVHGLKVLSDLDEQDVPEEFRAIFIDKIVGFLDETYGPCNQDKIFITEKFYKENQIYGLSSLPSFINPYPDGFIYELKMLKSLTRKWLKDNLEINAREEAWLRDGLVHYTMMRYIDEMHPDLKLAGKLSDVWGLNYFYASQLDFNAQYGLLYLNASRLNIDQALTTPADSLIKYNLNIASPYKAAKGFDYLEKYLEDGAFAKALKQFYRKNAHESTSFKDLRRAVEANSTKSVDWFFENYITEHTRIDWKIRSVDKTEDSIRVSLKNKARRDLPVPLYFLKDEEIKKVKWLPAFTRDTVVRVSRDSLLDADRVVLNYEEIIPEFSFRDNYKTLKPFPSFNRPLEFKLFKDAENPGRSQVFLMPEFTYNLYDGFITGPKLYNTTLLPKPFQYSIKPQYGFRSQTMLGSINFYYTHNFEDRTERLYSMRYGMSANRYSYADDLFYRRFIGYATIGFRPDNLRDNRKQFLSFKNTFVDRDRDPEVLVEQPDYNVFSASYSDRDFNLRNTNFFSTGIEISRDFGKVDFRYQWRKLFKNNRQFNLRLFAGAFIYNATDQNDNFFSFALDRPTDYLFNYNYYGRSEESGLFSQQLIIAEGGFKAQLDTPFANQWITTANTSFSLWRYFFLYGDVGLVKNQNDPATFVYDSGVRLNLLEDYFELYFPIYSKNGWEVGQGDYDTRIRFIVSLSLNTVIQLFSRRWY